MAWILSCSMYSSTFYGALSPGRFLIHYYFMTKTAEVQVLSAFCLLNFFELKDNYQFISCSCSSPSTWGSPGTARSASRSGRRRKISLCRREGTLCQVFPCSWNYAFHKSVLSKLPIKIPLIKKDQVRESALHLGLRCGFGCFNTRKVKTSSKR